MTGLVAGARVDPEVGWDENPGAHDHDVELVLAFLNTIDVEQGTDVLTEPGRWQDWVSGLRFEPHSVDDRANGSVEQVRAVRDALRAAVANGGSPANGAGGHVRVELLGGVPTLVAGDPLGAVLAAAARLAVLGDWDRVKICPADDCRWAFFDHSRNRSRTWCSMRVCGNRTKARNWRERARLRP